MKPQDDFDKWSSEFKYELENEKNYTAFYPDCEELINQYIQNGTLSSPIAKQTSTFVCKSIPTFARLVLKLKSLSKDILDLSINFLSKVLSLMTYRVINGKLEESKWVTDILNPKLDLYNRPNLGQFQKLCNLYIKNGDFQKLLDRTAGDKPDFQHLLLIYHLKKNIGSYVDIPINQIIPVLYKFITHFKDDVSLRTVDTVKLNKLVNKEILSNLKDEDPGDYTDLFKFSEYLIKTEIFDKQLLGVDTLTNFLEKVGKSNQSFSNWILSSDLMEYLCKTDLHVEIVKRITPLVKFCSKRNKFSLQMIESLFDKAAVIHKSEREPFYKLIISAFKGFDTKEVINFAQTHKPDNLFLSILMEQSSKNIEMLRFCVVTLLQNESKTQLLARLTKSIRSLIIEYVNSNFKSLNLAYLQDIMPELISTSKDAVAEFDEHIHIIVNDYAGKEDTQEFVLFVLKAYLIKTKTKTNLTIALTKKLFECQNDKLWSFFIDLLKDIGSDLFDDDSYKFIDQYLDEYDYSKVDSEMFVTFLNSYSYKSMQYHRQKNANSSDDSDIDEDFDLLLFPQSFLPIFLKAYFTIPENNNSPIYTKIQDYLLEFFISLSDDENGIMANAVNKALIPYLDPSNECNKKSSNLEMQRTLALLIKMINKTEDGIYLEDFGMQRHKDEIMYLPEMTLDFGGTKKVIHQDPEVQCSTLMKRIKTFTKAKTNPYYANYKLKVYSRGVEIEKSRIISSFHDMSLTVKNYGKFLKKQMISILLHVKYNLTNKLLELFKNQSINKNILDPAWELVQLLPSVKDVDVDLHSCKSEYLLRYSLELISLDKSFNDYSLLADLLISRKLKQSDIFIMNVILRLFNDAFVPYFPKMCKIILDQFKDQKDDKMINVPAQLMLKLAEKYDGSEKVLLQYIDDVVIMLFSVTKETIQPIFRTIDKIKSVKTIFDKSIDKLGSISELENKDFIVKALFSLYSSHPKDANSKKLVNAVMSIADNIQLDTLIYVITIYLETNKDDNSNLKKYVFDSLLNRIYKEDNPNDFDSYLNLKKYYSDIDSPLEKLILSPETKCKAFNVKPPVVSKDDDLDSDSNGFRGIENMGVTCFMNSTLQQLFFTFPFRYLVLTTEKDMLLYNIFSELIVPKKDSVSMKKYVSEVDQIINTDSQQDAFEFYQLLLDKQNEQCQSIFKGKLINHIEGINNDYSSVNKEDFTAIDLTVEEKNNLFEAFETFCDCDYFSLGDNKDVKKYIRIENVPQALVIQLKRFKLDYDTFTRYKINSKFEFPQSFNIAPYMDDPNIGEKIYELFGVVIHSGSANSGHYFSLIKLNGKWYEFNDSLVREFPEEKFEKVTFGSEQSQKNAYLLFYHEKDAVFTNDKISIRYDEVPDAALSAAIMNDLNKDKPHYCLFTESFLQFALSAPLQFQFYYFFKVFLHSTMNTESCEKLISKITKNLKASKNSKKDDSIKSFCKLAADETESFTGMLINCKSDDIKNSSILLMESIAENKYSFDFYNALIQNMDPFIVDWDKLSSLSQILLKVVPFHAKKAKSNGWDKKIIEFIQKFYKDASDKGKKTINFTDFFEILRILKVDDLSVLESNFKDIILSPSNSSILSLLNQKQKSSILSLFDNSDTYVQFIVKTSFPSANDDEEEEKSSESTNNSTAAATTATATSTNNLAFFVDAIFDHPAKKMKKASIMKSLYRVLKNKNQETLKQVLIDNYPKLILPLFFDPISEVRSNAENITYQLYNEIGALDFDEESSSSSDSGTYYYNPTVNNAQQKTTKAFKDFEKKMPEYVNKAVTLINDKYTNQYPMIINYLNTIIWHARQMDVFNLLLPIYQVVKKRNDKEAIPDANFVDTVTTIKKCLVCLEANEVSKHEKDLTAIIYQLFKYGSFQQTSEILFQYMTHLPLNSLINVYKSPEFMSFFKKETKLKKSEESFKKSYDLNKMFTSVISESDELTNKFIKFVKEESNLVNDHMTITIIVEMKPDFVPSELYLASINYVIDCALENLDFDLFREMISAIKNTFQEKVDSGLNFSGIDDKKLTQSFVFLRGSDSRSKRFYGEFISNVCSKNEKLTKIVLNKLIEILANIKNDDQKEYRYYIYTYLNVIGATNKYEYYDTFIRDIFPLAPITFWANTKKSIFITFSVEHFNELPNSKKAVVRELLLKVTLTKTKNSSTYTFVSKYVQSAPDDEIIDMLNELSKIEEKSCYDYNLKVVLAIRPELNDDSSD